MVTAIGCDGWADIECAGGMVVPSKAFEWRVVNITQLASWEKGVCSEIEGEMVEAVVGRKGWVWVPGL